MLRAISRWAVFAGAVSALDAMLAQQAHINQDWECPFALNAWEELFQTRALLRPARTAILGPSQPTERQYVLTVQQASSPLQTDAPCQTGDARIALQELSRQDEAWVTRVPANRVQQAPMLGKDPPRARNAQQENHQA